MNKIIKLLQVIGVMGVLLNPFNAQAFIGDGGAGWAQIPYFVKLVAENIKRYQQLKVMISQAKNSDQYMKLINAGVDNAVGILKVLPVEDQKILGTLKNFKVAFDTVQEVYGVIPKSGESAMHMLHDQTVAEGIKMYNSLTAYVREQEANAIALNRQSQNASPRGAARMNAQVSAQILHTLNQLLKVNGQILKLGSEQFAMSNKTGKEEVGAYNRVNKDIGQSLGHFRPDFSLTRF